MKIQRVGISLLAILTTLQIFKTQAWAQTVVTADDDVRGVINTAGYSALFGAAMGAALIPFIPDPGLSSLRYIASGASIGFFVGSGVALYRLTQNDTNAGFIDQGPSDADYYEEDTSTSIDIQKLKNEIKQAASDRTNSIPQGALFVGNKSAFRVNVPAIAVGPNFGAIQLLDYRF